MRLRLLPLLAIGLLALAFFLAPRRASERVIPATAPPATADLAPTLALAPPAPGIDLSGIVVDAARAPIAGARVECIALPASDVWGLSPPIEAEPEVSALAHTGPDGSFSFPLGAGGVRDLRVTHPGYGTIRLAERTAGERLEIELHPAATVVIRAVDPRGAPAPGTIVRLAYAIDGARASDRVDHLRARVTETGDGGIARFEDLPPGRARIELEHVRFARPRPREVEIVAGSEVSREVTLLAGYAVEGTVRDRESGAAIAGAILRTGKYERPRAITDALGRFRCEGFPNDGGRGLSGTDLLVVAPGHAPEAVWIDPPLATPLEIMLAAPAIAEGTVVDEAGEPLHGVRVRVHWHTSGGMAGSVQSRSAHTGSDGVFRVESLPPDHSLQLALFPPQCSGRRVDYEERRRSTGGRFDFGTIVLPNGFTVSGTLTGSDGRPLAGAAIRISGPRSTAGGDSGESDGIESPLELFDHRRSDQLGRLLFPDIPPGEFWIWAEIPGRQEISEHVRVADGDIAIRLVAPAALAHTVEVRSEEGEPIQGAQVFIGGKYDTLGPVATDRAGIARFAGTTPGEAWVTILPPPGFVEPEPVPLTDLASHGPIVLVRAARIAGKVIAPPGATLDGLKLRAVAKRPGEELGRTFELRANEDGSFETIVPVGSIVGIECRGDAGGFSIYDSDLARWEPFAGTLAGIAAPAETLELQLTPLTLDRALSVRVSTPDGAPVARARVWITVREQGATISSEETDSTGIARFRALPAMELRVTALPPHGLDSETVRWVDPDSVTLVPAGQAIERTLRRSFPLRVDIGEPVDGRYFFSLLTWRTSTGREGENFTLEGKFELSLLEGETADLRVVGERDGSMHAAEIIGVPAGTPRARLVLRPR